MDIGNWNFKGSIVEDFDEHVRNSIPGYELIQNLIVDMSQFFIRENDLVYDLGSSTGTTIYNLKNNIKKPFNIVGVDMSKGMLDKSKKNLCNMHGVDLICEDIENLTLEKCNLVICNLTLCFISMDKREEITKKIYNSLNIGGAMIIVDKTYPNSCIHQDMYTQIYNDFKYKNRFTAEEILTKERSIRSVLTPKKNEDNIEMLKNQGFVIEEFFRYLNFVGYIAIK